MQLKIVSVDTGREVQLHEGSFLLRIFSVEDGSVQRCFIRHIASGREAYVQGGPHLQTFVKACVLADSEGVSESTAPGESKKHAAQSNRSETESPPLSSPPEKSMQDQDSLQE